MGGAQKTGMDECGIYTREEEEGRGAYRRQSSGPERGVNRSLLQVPSMLKEEAYSQAGVLPHHGPRHPQYATYTSRLATFQGCWPPGLRQRPEDMAEAGLVYLGLSDQVKCFHCDGGLREWGEEDEPWVEHAGWFGSCEFVLLVKGRQFVEMSKRKVTHTLETRRASISESVAADKLAPLPPGSAQSEDKVQLKEVAPRSIEEENLRLKQLKICKVCLDAEVGVVFLPCGHLCCCVSCSPSLKDCPVCRAAIQGTVRTYMS